MFPHIQSQILFWDFFVDQKFVDSIDVPHDAHVLQAKHFVTFYYPIELDSSTTITYSNSHTLEP